MGTKRKPEGNHKHANFNPLVLFVYVRLVYKLDDIPKGIIHMFKLLTFKGRMICLECLSEVWSMQGGCGGRMLEYEANCWEGKAPQQHEWMQPSASMYNAWICRRGTVPLGAPCIVYIVHLYSVHWTSYIVHVYRVHVVQIIPQILHYT